MNIRPHHPLTLAALMLALAACNPATDAVDPPTAIPEAAQATGDSVAASAHDADAPPPTDAHAAHGETLPLPSAPAKPWATDAPLREGMTGIAAAVAQARAAKDAGGFGAEQAKTLAATVDERFKFMLANCKLEPEADVALHALLAQFVASSRELEADPAAAVPMAHLQELLALYPRYFDHPGWLAPAAHG